MKHFRGKYHCTVDLRFDSFRNVPACCIKHVHISTLFKQEVNCTVTFPPYVFPDLMIVLELATFIGPAPSSPKPAHA